MNPQPLQSTGEALNRYAKLCAEHCDRAQHIWEEREDPSPITEMAREVIVYCRHLAQFEHMLSAAYSLTKRMAELLEDHPRLLLELKQVELETLEYVESTQGHELGITEDLRDEIRLLEANIRAADEGRWDDIHDGRMLKSDPVEWTKEYEDVIDDVHREAYANLTDCPRGMGFCFGYWAEKGDALARRGIEWQSPSALNPGVMFD